MDLLSRIILRKSKRLKIKKIKMKSKLFWKNQVSDAMIYAIILATHSVALNITDGIESDLTIYAVILIFLNMIKSALNTLITEEKINNQ